MQWMRGAGSVSKAGSTCKGYHRREGWFEPSGKKLGPSSENGYSLNRCVMGLGGGTNCWKKRQKDRVMGNVLIVPGVF